MDYDVSIVPCSEYTSNQIAESLHEAIDAIGGFDFIKPGIKVAVKCNLVARMNPETGATVNPVLASELCKMLISRGAEVTLGDSPGGPWTSAWVNSIYSGTGMRIIEKTGAKLNQNFSQKNVIFEHGVRVKEFPITSWLTEADYVIDLCKLKTHALTGFTCAVKNFFGAIPGTHKPEFHYLNPQLSDFCNMLIDLNEYIKPKLVIVDAVLGMEGNGPTMGSPRKIGVIMAAKSPYSADFVASRLINMDDNSIPTVKAAINRGLCPDSIDKLKIYGNIDKHIIYDFKKQPIRDDIRFREKWPIVNVFLSKNFGTGPKVNSNKCVGCKKCEQTCPMQTIHIVNEKAKINSANCIRCFCCQEFCPQGAITIHRPLVARIFG